MKILFMYALLVAAGTAEFVSYEGFKVYQLLPTNEEQLQLLELHTKSEDYDVWSPIRQGAEVVDVMVNPKAQPEFCNFLDDAGIQYTILLENVESTIQIERKALLGMSKPRSGEINFYQYHRYSEIQAYLLRLANTYSYVSVESIGKSYQKRDVDIVKISKNLSAKNPVIFIDGGIHAREWIAPAVVLYIIHQLVENPKFSHLLDKVDWYIIPVLNPDGYEYSFTDRMWRKTRSKITGSNCLGADGNRNFGFHFGGPGSGSNPCSEIYKGEKAFSEAETMALRDYIWKIRSDVKLYLTFHSYGSLILYPWSYTSEYPENADELDHLGELAAAGIKKHSGTSYVVGSSTNVLGPTAGSSDDWVKGEAGVELAYTIELPSRGHGFFLPPEQILPVVEETWLGVVAFHEYIESEFA